MDESGLVRVTETGESKFQVEARIGDHRLLADEPVEVGGADSGPDPYELLSAALGACTVLTARLYAERKGWPLKRTHAEVRHYAGEGPPRDRFERRVAFEGELTDEQRTRLYEIIGKCPVHRTLTEGSRVDTLPLELERVPHASLEHFRDMDEICTE